MAAPAAAFGADEDAAEPRIAVAAGVPVGGVLVADHAATLRREMRQAARRIRTQRRARIRREEREAFATLPAGVSMSTLDAIAACESGGDPTAVSSDGSYRGKYQFSFETWAAVGGSGDPAAASEAEQDYRAALLYAQSGSSPWPVCG
ncbi:MAG TPA: transglycosylase family protein [Solirubrobacterales bacterium]|nr:transglycosylase family protein [Solirubrobacterales bacterium]